MTIKAFSPCGECLDPDYCDRAVDNSRIIVTAMLQFADIAVDSGADVAEVYGDVRQVELINEELDTTVSRLEEVNCSHSEADIKTFILGDL